MGKTLNEKTDDELYEKIRYCGDDNGFAGDSHHNFLVVDACIDLLKSRHPGKGAADQIDKKASDVYEKAHQDAELAYRQQHDAGLEH